MERELRELPYPPINDWGWPDSPGSSNAPCPPSPVMSMQQPRKFIGSTITPCLNKLNSARFAEHGLTIPVMFIRFRSILQCFWLPIGQQVANFIRSKLEGPGRDDTLVTWYDRDKGIFRVVNSRRLANLWGAQKNRPNMTFAKMARGIR